MRYILKRLGFLLFTIWVAVTINFVLPRLVPGDPVGAMIARAQGQIGPEAAKALRIAYGLADQPENLLVQYVQYLGKLLQGDLGRSINYFPTPVSQVISVAAPWTIGLVGVSTIFAFLIGSGLGLLSAYRRGSRLADAAVPFALFVNSMPYFWFALLMLYFLAFKLSWFPLSGGYDITYAPRDGFPYYFSIIKHSLLPALAIVITASGGWLMTMRNNAMSTMGEDFVAFGRAKGLSERRILYTYVARNAVLPSLTAFAMALGFVIGGSIVTEIVFSYPGLGTLLYQAIVALDYPLMQAIFLFIAVAVLVANFLVDLTYVLLDPRVRVEGGAA
jgi:peptide/nickel transport system permease protein